MSFNTLDFFILFVIFSGALYGIYKGFVHSLLSFAGKILSAVLTVRFLGKFIEFFKIKELFLKGTLKIVGSYVPLAEDIKNINIKDGNVDISGSLLENNMFAKIMGKNISREIEGLYGKAGELSLETVGDMMSLILANYIINILSFIALFLLILVGFSFLKVFLVKIIGASSLITGLDKILGFVFGGGVNILILAFVLGVSFDLLNLISLKDTGLLNGYKNLINSSLLKEQLYYIYNIVINEGVKLL